jgi:hypothetical protein
MYLIFFLSPLALCLYQVQRLLNQVDTINCTGSVYSTTLRGKPSYAATHPPRQLSQDTHSSTT